MKKLSMIVLLGIMIQPIIQAPLYAMQEEGEEQRLEQPPAQQPQVNEEVQDNQCSVCQGPQVNALQLPCNHSFCSACITEWLIRRSSCPLCRTNIREEFYDANNIAVPVNQNNDENALALNRFLQLARNARNVPMRLGNAIANNACRVCNDRIDDNSDSIQRNTCGCIYHTNCLRQMITLGDTNICSCGQGFDTALLAHMVNVSSFDTVRHLIAMGSSAFIDGASTYFGAQRLLAAPNAVIGFAEVFATPGVEQLALLSMKPALSLMTPTGGTPISLIRQTSMFLGSRCMSVMGNLWLAHRYQTTGISNLHLAERVATGTLELGARGVVNLFNKNNVLNTRRAYPLAQRLQNRRLATISQAICFTLGFCAGRFLYKPLREFIACQANRYPASHLIEAGIRTGNNETPAAMDLIKDALDKMKAINDYRQEKIY